MSYDISVVSEKGYFIFATKKYLFASNVFRENSDLVTSFPQKLKEFGDHWSKKRNSLCIMTPCGMSF